MRVHYFLSKKLSTLVNATCFSLTKLRRLMSTAITLLVVVLLLVAAIPVQAVVMAPMLNVFGVVTDSVSGQPLAGVSVSITGPLDHYDVITGNDGLYQSGYITCGFDFSATYVDISISYAGYQDYSQTVSAPCYSSYEHNIALQPAGAAPEPVILIPGIMGSWNANLLNGIPWAEDKWVLDPILHTYDQLVDNLVLYGGYVLGETLFPFPYDWRSSNITTAALLRDKINEVKSITGADKVDIVAHSMGGLIARYYVESSLYQNDVDQVIFIATPHRGAPKSYLAWEGGYTGVRARTDFIKESILKQVAVVSGYDSVFDYVRNYPVSAVQELLPDYAYLIDKNTGKFIPYSKDSADYPQNKLLHFLNQTANIDLFFDRVGETTIIYSSDSGSTPVSYEVVPPKQDQLPKWEHGYPDGFGRFSRTDGVNLGDGDTTVPGFSSTDLSVDRLIEKVGVGHMGIVSYSSANVLDILQGVYMPITVVDEPDNYIIIQVYSPLDIQVISPSGLAVGSDFTGGEVNEVPGAYYSGLGAKAEFVVIPNPEPGEYQIKTQGTGVGEFSIDVSFIDDNGLDTQSVSGVAAPEMEIDFSFVNQQGINDLLPEDQSAPVITISSPTNRQYLHSDIVPVDYTVMDEGTGVSYQQAYLNNEETADPELDLFELELGEYEFKVKAKDMVNNQAEKVVSFEVIANFDSLRADINRLYNEGDIKDKKTKNDLLKRIDKLEKWYNKKAKHKDKHKDKDKGDDDRDEDWKELGHKARDKWLTELADKYLNKLERKGKISPKANDMISEQLEYIINHL